jgi:hypothetical protein
MSEYRIEKVRRRVSVTLSGGTMLHGEIFLQPTARYRAGPQEPAELFNETEAFLPLATGTEESVLLAKRHVSRVQYDAEAADTDGRGGVDAAVEVVFTDGTRLSGQLRLETRTDRSRLLDYLNGDNQRFLTLRSSNRIWLVNREQIAQVLPRH